MSHNAPAGAKEVYWMFRQPYTVDQLQTILTVDFGIKPHSAPLPPPVANDRPQSGL